MQLKPKWEFDKLDDLMKDTCLELLHNKVDLLRGLAKEILDQIDTYNVREERKVKYVLEWNNYEHQEEVFDTKEEAFDRGVDVGGQWCITEEERGER